MISLRKKRRPKIVVIGGGTGLPVVLKGLRKKNADITAVVTVADDGGSSGIIRDYINVVPPGDIRNVLAALSDMPKLYKDIFQYRFSSNDQFFSGHAIGNLIIAALTEMDNRGIFEAVQDLSKIMQDEHIFSGEQQPMLKSDTLVVTRDNYRTVLSDDDLGRLVRFEGVESRFGTALWGYKNTFPNYFANSVSYDVNSPGWEDIDQWATWATMRMLPGTNADTFFYGSAWFTYDAQAAGTGTNAAPGNYVVRTSGYSQFRDNKIPVSGSVVDLTAIYTKFTNGSGNYATYQLTLNTDRDVVVK